MQVKTSNVGEFPEVTATAGGCSSCWKLWRLLEAATGCRRGPQYDGKCSFYFNCHFFRTPPTNRDLRQKAVYFKGWLTANHRLTATVTSLQWHTQHSGAAGAWISHLAPIVVYIEFAWNYANFNSNYYYFMKTTHILKPQSYTHKLQKS